MQEKQLLQQALYRSLGNCWIQAGYCLLLVEF